MELWTAFILGLVGSLHCGGMCGPLALALPGSLSRSRFLAGRLAYNTGRIVTYSFLGLLFGAMGKTLALAGFQRWLSLSLGILLLAGLFASKRATLAPWLTRSVNFLKNKMAALLRRRTLSATASLGLLNGFLPCGLVYVAAAAAGATGHIASSVAYMAAFGAGTLPMMLTLSLSGRLMPFTLRLRLQRLIPASVFLIATLLILRGMALGVPYLSPDLAHGACCQK
jgi:sulfite exporter TauE/SafE